MESKPLVMKKPFTTNLSNLNYLYAAVDKAVERSDAYGAHRAWVAYLDYLRDYNRERGIPFRSRLK